MSCVFGTPLPLSPLSFRLASAFLGSIFRGSSISILPFGVSDLRGFVAALHVNGVPLRRYSQRIL